MVRALLACALVAVPVLAGPAWAADYQGLSLSTDYPSITTTPGQVITLKLNVHNYGMPPQRVNLSVLNSPKNWNTALVGGGKLVGAVFVAPGQDAKVDLWVEPPEKTAPGDYSFSVRATGPSGSFNLPITISLGKTLPGRIALKPEFPSLKGTQDSKFSYRVKVTNLSTRDALVTFKTEAPEGFQVSYTEAYGSQDLTSLPLDAGDSKDIDMKVGLPQGISAGTYPLKLQAVTEGAQAETELTMEVTGQAKLTISGRQGELSGSAYAGKEKAFTLVVQNDGSAPATDVDLSAYQPTNWKVDFNPKTIKEIAAGKSQEVTALVTPSSKAIAGDYMVTLNASGSGASDSEKFRVTVRTSTLWGIIAILVIAASLVVVALAVMKYGRR